MKALVVVGALLIPTLAFADKPLPASQHSPPIILDEPSVNVRPLTQGDRGWNVMAHIEMKGVTSTSDRARLEWKQGGKLLATAKCQLEFDGDYAMGNCDDRDTNIKVTGDVTADLIYSDDKTDKEYLVRTFKITIVHLKGQWETWGSLADDTLGAAFMYEGHEKDNNGTYRRPTLYMTFANANTPPDPGLRCTVDGKALDNDIKLDAETGADTQDLELDHQPKNNGKRLTFHWSRSKLLMDIYWGKRETLSNPKDTHAALVDHPGKYECNLRSEGHVLRTISFVVNADGMIQNDEMNTGKNAIPMISDREVMVDMRMGKDAAQFDTRINPAAMKKSLEFGLPWPDHAKVKQIQATYAKSGLPDPQ